ncbi:hypothetical protein EfmAA818_13400 [Enterococcus faecium]|nr:hypothetical protein EfmAA818_13400 [Enterococcus faecium]
MNSFDKKGVPFSEINKIVLYQPKGSKIVKMNFFRNGWRGPMLKFTANIQPEDLFLSQRLNDEAEIDIMIDPE